MPIPLLAGLAIAAGGIGLGAVAQKTFVRPRDEAFSGNYNDKTQDVLEVFEKAERGEGFRGIDRVVASSTIRDIPAETRFDFANGGADLGLLEAFLEHKQQIEVEKAHQDPSRVGFGTPWVTALTQLKRGSFFEGFGMLMEAPARNLDKMASDAAGELDSLGRHTARKLGLEEDSVPFKAISGGVDLSKILFADPLIVGGKAYKTYRGVKKGAEWALKLPGAQAWARKMADVDDPAEIWRLSRLGGGDVDRKLARKIANTKDEVEVLDLMADGMTRGEVMAVPTWYRANVVDKMSIVGRAPLNRLGRRTWNTDMNFHSPTFEDDVFEMFQFLTGDSRKAAKIVTQIPAYKDPERAIPTLKKMYDEAFSGYTGKLMEPELRRLTKKFDVEASSFDELADALTERLGGKPYGMSRKEFEGTGEKLLHGASRKFSRFGSAEAKTRHGRSVEGGKFYFTKSRDVAERFAGSQGYRQVSLDRYAEGLEETAEEALPRLRRDLDEQLERGRTLVYSDPETGALRYPKSASEVPRDDLLDGDVRLYEPGYSPEVIEATVYGKTLDLTDPAKVPDELKELLEREGAYDPSAPLPSFGHEYSRVIPKWAREHGYGKIRVRDVAESDFESVIALEEFIGKGRDDVYGELLENFVSSERLRETGRRLGLSFDEGASPERMLEAIDSAIRNRPSRVHDAAMGEVRRRGGGVFTAEEHAFGTHLLPDGIRPPGDIPGLESQTAHSLATPSYMDLSRYTAEVAGQVEKMGFAKVGLSRALNRADSMMSGLRSLWIMRVATTMRNMMDETLAFMGHPRYGKEYRRALMDQMLDIPAKGLAAGARRLGMKGKYADAPVPRIYRDLLEESEQVAKMAVPEDRLRSTRVMESYAASRGPVKAGVRKEAEKMGDEFGEGYVYMNVSRDQIHYPQAWHHAVNEQLLNDRGVGKALQYWDEPEEGRRILREWFDSAEGQAYRKNLPKHWSDNPDDWVESRFEFIKGHLPDDELVDIVRHEGYVPFEKLKNFWKQRPDDAPSFMHGLVSVNDVASPNARRVQSTLFDTLRNKFFGAQGAFIDYAGRNPAHAAVFKKRRQELRELARKRGTLGVTVDEDEIDRAAKQFAGKHVIRYADTKLDQRRYEVLFRGFLPFADAHRRYITRWGRIFKENPAFAEKSRLLFGAMENMGWVEPDERGNLVFQVPILPDVAEKLLPGEKELWDSWFSFRIGRQEEPGVRGPESLIQPAIPEGLPFSIDIFPGFSPLLTIPMDWLAMAMPNLRESADAVLGPAPGWDPEKNFMSNMFSQMWGGWLEKLTTAFEDQDHHAAKANAAKDAAQWRLMKFHEENGRFPSKDEFQEVMKGADKVAAGNFIARGILQFLSPFTPVNLPYGQEVAEFWHKNRTRFGPERAYEMLMDEFGEGAHFYTVGKTEWTEGAGVAFSEEAEEFFVNNRDFFEDHPEVAGFFTRDMAEGFDIDVYGRMRRRGHQQVKPPASWVGEGMYRLGNKEYYEEIRPKYEIAQELAQTEEQKFALARWLEAKRYEIDHKYPGWLEAWSEWSKRQQQRESTHRELMEAIQHPAVRDMPVAEDLREFLRVYESAKGAARQAGIADIGRSKKLLPVRQWLAGRAKEIMARSGSQTFESIYQFLYQPELESFEDELQMELMRLGAA